MRRQSSFNRNRREVAKKEKIIMITSSALVLGALTMTGMYVRGGQEKKQDGYRMDYEKLEKNMGDDLNKEITEHLPSIFPNANQVVGESAKNSGKKTEAEGRVQMDDDLDYWPMEPVGSDGVKISDWGIDEMENPIGEGPIAEGPMEELPVETPSPVEKELHFDADAGIAWPVSGSVLIPYSMDATVYFKTLDQYKYSPAMVISAKEDTAITSFFEGKVSSVFYDDEIGSAITLSVGDGYEITYGQLKDIAVKKGDYVENGTLLGTIATPTKYYIGEGSNLYIKMCKDGVPVDPMHPNGEIVE